MEEYQERWDVIAEHFPDRSDVQCQQRWTKVVNPELVKGPWTKEVIQKLQNIEKCIRNVPVTSLLNTDSNFIVYSFLSIYYMLLYAYFYNFFC